MRPIRRGLQRDGHLLYPRSLDVLLAAASVAAPIAPRRLVAVVGSVSRGGPGGISRRTESDVPPAGAAAARVAANSGIQPAGVDAVSTRRAQKLPLSAASCLRGERGARRD